MRLRCMRWSRFSWSCKERLLYRGLGVSLLAVSVMAASALAQAKPVCEKLKDLQLPDTSITSAENVAAGPFALPPGMPAPAVEVPAFCRVRGEIKPSSDSHINFEVWMPAAQWNGKFQQIGNGRKSSRRFIKSRQVFPTSMDAPKVGGKR